MRSPAGAKWKSWYAWSCRIGMTPDPQLRNLVAGDKTEMTDRAAEVMTFVGVTDQWPLKSWDTHDEPLLSSSQCQQGQSLLLSTNSCYFNVLQPAIATVQHTGLSIAHTSHICSLRYALCCVVLWGTLSCDEQWTMLEHTYIAAITYYMDAWSKMLQEARYWGAVFNLGCKVCAVTFLTAVSP